MDQTTPDLTPGSKPTGGKRELSALSKALTLMMGDPLNSVNESPDVRPDDALRDLGEPKDSPEEGRRYPGPT